MSTEPDKPPAGPELAGVARHAVPLEWESVRIAANVLNSRIQDDEAALPRWKCDPERFEELSNRLAAFKRASAVLEAALHNMTIDDINEAFAQISPEALTSGRNADGVADGSNDWDHPSAEAARAVTEELGMCWEFTTWEDARHLAIQTLQSCE